MRPNTVIYMYVDDFTVQTQAPRPAWSPLPHIHRRGNAGHHGSSAHYRWHHPRCHGQERPQNFRQRHQQIRLRREALTKSILQCEGAQPTVVPITMFGRPRWSGPGRRFRYDFPALSSMIRGCCRRERGRPMTADRNQAGYTDASGAHGAGLVVMWVRRGRPDSSEPAATGKPS